MVVDDVAVAVYVIVVVIVHIIAYRKRQQCSLFTDTCLCRMLCMMSCVSYGQLRVC
jgi:hypothetical protein